MKKLVIHVYLTPEEKLKIENESNELGISMSAYIKVKLFSKRLE